MDDAQMVLAKALTEKQLQTHIVRAAKLMRWGVYHTFDARRSEAGFPDLVMVRGRRLIFAELKRENGRTTPAQKAWIEALHNVAEVYEWRPSNWYAGEVDEVLR
jgi:hypothetical protein